jgi:hypothetical protein
LPQLPSQSQPLPLLQLDFPLSHNMVVSMAGLLLLLLL